MKILNKVPTGAIGFFAMVFLVVALATSCGSMSSSQSTPTPTNVPNNPSDTQVVTQRVPDGRNIVCITNAYGLSCDWSQG